MLRALRLVNFRSLQDTGLIELRPLTVLVGANSSGKSSFLRFFPLLRQTMREESGSPLLFFGADVDFGEFKDVVSRHASEPIIRVELSLRWIDEDDARFQEERDILVDLLRDETSGSYVCRIESRTGARHIIVHVDASGVIQSATLDGCEASKEAFERIRLQSASLIAGVSGPSELWESLYMSNGEDRSDELNLFSDLFYHLHLSSKELRNVARNVDYIGPFRSVPQRFYRRSELAVDRISKEGDNLALVLSALSMAKRREFSAWVQEHFGFGVRIEPDGSHLVLKIEETPGVWINLVDTGFGLSQVLPVIVQSWLATQSPGARRSHRSGENVPSLFAVEQPELHLHPRHQAHLADMFVGLMKGTKELGRHMPILVETHSEALVNRLGELVATSGLDARDVVVLVFERDAEGRTTIRQSEFDGEGALQNWPLGFFLA